MKITKKLATEITGGLSSPSKMPCPSYSIPASECKIGSLLRKVKGSTCETCYAADDWDWVRGKAKILGKWKSSMYAQDNTQKAMRKRFESLDHPQWVDAMVVLIGGNDYFRWHDSGDLQSVEHLDNIVKVCKQTPNTKHWLPTREWGIVKAWMDANGKLPQNLIVRASAAMREMAPPSGWKHTSTVSAGVGRECPAPKQNNECKDCRACWNKRIHNIDYKWH